VAARPIQVLKGMLLVPLVIIAALALIWRVLPPISTLMVWQTITGGTVRRTYVPLERISPRLVAAVINAEDARFCHHIGVDWHELGKVLETDGGPRRGASTLTMQTAKNLFLWQSPLTYLRKGLEIPLALGLDLTWPKRRVIEVYLNVAEWGDGIFGAEAAARAHFGKSAAELSAREAALLAAALPNPILRNPAKPSRGHANAARRINARAQANPDGLDCLS